MRWRLAYNLRTLLAAMAVVALWLGWTSHVVRERKAALEELGYHGFYATEPGQFSGIPSPSSPRVSWIRSLMGDQAIYHIALSNNVEDEELERYARQFPEAVVFRLDFAW